MANFSFVADSKFNPLSREDVLTPLLMYKQAYDETEAAYDKLSKDSNVFSYLSKVAEENADSEAAKIYKGYADELNTQAQSLAQNGLSMANKRALLNLKRRYDSEIGVLERAQKSLEQERELRRNNKDASMLYGVDNLNIDQFLYDKTPNLYKVSGNELYQKGAIIGKSFSSRMNETTEGTGRILGGYFRDYITRKGITPQDLNQFSDEILDDFTREVSVLPELQQAAKSVLTSYGADTNLTGANLRKAQHQVIRGIVDNAIYEENHNPVRDAGVMDAAGNLNATIHGLEFKNGRWTYNPDLDPSIAKAKAVAALKNNGDSNKGKGASTDRKLQLSNKIRITWDDDPETSKYKIIELDDTSTSTDGYEGEGTTYAELPDNIKRAVDKTLEGSDPNLYHYYYVPWESGAINDTEASVDIIPYKVITTNNDSEDASDSFGE